MAKVVVFGIEGEADLWIADLGAGTVSKIAKPTQGELASADKLRTAGTAVVKGVNLAVTAQSSASVAGGFMDG
jgi:hypothetical protein